jgi:glycerophosphoryl diester phosphodiesterase
MPSTLVFAHRGASSEAAENTRGAFEKALARPIDGIETDIQLSRDEIPVLWHDEDLKKVGLPGRRTEEFDLTQLKGVDLGAWFTGARQGESILTLEELLQDFGTQCQWLLEIKCCAGETVQRQRIKVRRCLELAAPFHERAESQTIRFSSFHLDSLIYACHCTTAWPYIYNCETIRSTAEIHRLLDQHAFLAGLCLPIQTLKPELVEAVHGRGKILATYTCNSDEEIGRALDLNVDILISDDPAKALRLREAHTA